MVFTCTNHNYFTFNFVNLIILNKYHTWYYEDLKKLNSRKEHNFWHFVLLKKGLV